MSKISKLFGVLAPRNFQADDGRHEPELAAARKLHRKKEPALAAANWQAIKENLQAEVSGLVPKSIAESIYRAPPVVSPVDQGFLVQVAAIFTLRQWELTGSAGQCPIKTA